MATTDAKTAAAARNAAAARFMALLDELGLRTWLLDWGGTAQAHGDAPIYKYGINASHRFAELNPAQQDALLEMVREVHALCSTELFLGLVGRAQRYLTVDPLSRVEVLGDGRYRVTSDRPYLPVVIVTTQDGDPIDCQLENNGLEYAEDEHGTEPCWHKLFLALWLLGDYGSAQPA